MGAELVIGNLIRAEFRKLLSTKLWWVLLIPSVLLALGWSWIWSALATSFAEALAQDPDFRQLGVSLDNLPIAGFGMARAINITTIFPMVLGGLAVASEIQRKTITTTFLTASTRLSVLSAKLITYVAVGLIYGLLNVGVCGVGILLGARGHSDLLPSAENWLLLAGAGILATLMWTLLAVGLGALLGNTIATLLSLLLYSILVENLLVLVLPFHIPAFLPNQAADGMTSSVAAQALLDRIGPDQIPSYLRDPIEQLVRTIAGAKGVYSWWLEALVFLGWTAIFFGFGWFGAKRRDIT